MTNQLPYFYETETEWVTGKVVTAESSGLPDIPVAPPPEFGGESGFWTPEHLSVAAVNACFAVTLLAIARNSKLDFVSFNSIAIGKLEKVEGSGLQITEIVLKPTLVIRQERDLEKAVRILEKAEQGCLISNSMKATTRLEPQVTAELPKVPELPERLVA